MCEYDSLQNVRKDKNLRKNYFGENHCVMFSYLFLLSLVVNLGWGRQPSPDFYWRQNSHLRRMRGEVCKKFGVGVETNFPQFKGMVSQDYQTVFTLLITKAAGLLLCNFFYVSLLVDRWFLNVFSRTLSAIFCVVESEQTVSDSKTNMTFEVTQLWICGEM